MNTTIADLVEELKTAFKSSALDTCAQVYEATIGHSVQQNLSPVQELQLLSEQHDCVKKQGWDAIVETSSYATGNPLFKEIACTILSDTWQEYINAPRQDSEAYFVRAKAYFFNTPSVQTLLNLYATKKDVPTRDMDEIIAFCFATQIFRPVFVHELYQVKNEPDYSHVKEFINEIINQSIVLKHETVFDYFVSHQSTYEGKLLDYYLYLCILNEFHHGIDRLIEIGGSFKELENSFGGTVAREKFELAQKNYTLRQLAYTLEENLPNANITYQKIKI